MLQTAKTPLFIEVVTLADDWWNLISSTWFLLSAVEMTHYSYGIARVYCNPVENFPETVHQNQSANNIQTTKLI